MESLQSILLIIHIVVAILIVAMVLLQPSSSGDGLVSTYSATGNFMSARAAANFMTKFTMILAIIFMTNTLLLGMIATKKSSANSIVEKVLQEQEGEDNISVPLAE